MLLREARVVLGVGFDADGLDGVDADAVEVDGLAVEAVVDISTTDHVPEVEEERGGHL